MNTSRTKVIFLIPTLTSGGAERVIVNLLRHLDQEKFDLKLAVVNMNMAVYQDDLPDHVELIDLKCSRVRFAIFKIISLLWKLKPNVVFSTLGHLNIMLAILKPLLPSNIRYLCRETTILSEGLKSYANPTFFAWAYKRFYARFNKIICQSTYMRDDLRDNFGISTDKLVVINNPVDIVRVRGMAKESIAFDISTTNKSETRKKNRKINLVSVGRLVHTKGFDLLIEALALVGNPSLHVTILGEGPLLEQLKAKATEYKVINQVHFVDFQKNPFTFMAWADAYVLSSRYEGFPNVVLEALACGTPVIATPAIGGTREILEGLEGCAMAASVTAQGLADVLSTFEFGNRLSLDVVKPFEIAKIVNCYEQQFLA